MIKRLASKFGRWIFRTLAFIGLITITINLGMFIYAYKLANKKTEMPEQVVLSLNIDGDLAASPNASPLDKLFGNNKQDLFSITNSIKKAAKDDRVYGLVADIGMAEVSSAEAKEIHDALDIFHKAGKFTIAYADTFSEGGNALSQYYLASGFNEIWMQPSGTLFLVGLAAEIPFLKDTFAKFGIQPDFVKFTDWKSGPNMFANAGFTPEHRKTMEDIVNGLFDIVVTGIQTNRKSLPAEKSLFLDGPYTAEQSLEHKLIDKTAYNRELQQWVLEQLPLKENNKEEEPKTVDFQKKLDKHFIPVAQYSFAAVKSNDEKPVEKKDKDAELAIVFATGQIMRGDAEVPRPFGGTSDETVRANTLAKSIFDAADAENTRAIVLRVDSPGGSYVASDTIRHAILYAKSKNIPIVVSMGRLAASGGYFISMDADKIYAQPSTLTGSIGVYGGKFALQDLLTEKLDVNIERVVVGEKATMLSPSMPFTELQREALEENMQTVFADFSNKATMARPQIDVSVEGILGGRVFTGITAQRFGLIDELGGLQDAIRAAKQLANLDTDALYSVVLYPKQKTPAEALRGLLTGDIAVPTLPLNLKMFQQFQQYLDHMTINDAALSNLPEM